MNMAATKLAVEIHNKDVPDLYCNCFLWKVKDFVKEGNETVATLVECEECGRQAILEG